jgi:hypothetical protein
MLFILASFVLGWLILALRDGSIGAIPYLLASLLLGCGIALLIYAKKTYGA